MKPIYCTNEQADNCRECSFSSYGRDCQNERIQDDEEHTRRMRKYSPLLSSSPRKCK